MECLRAGSSGPRKDWETAALAAGTAVALALSMPKRKSVDSGQGATPALAGDSIVASGERERIASRAYELYLSRGGAHGQAEEDWLIAEREVSKRDRSRSES